MNLSQLTAELIKFKTITGSNNEVDKAFSFISNFLSKLHIKQFENNGFKSLAISNTDFNRKKFDLILHGHIDVVPAKNNKDFIPYFKKNRLFGRGALDMKGGLACLLMIMKNYELIIKKPKKILLLITSDEETGGKNGSEYLLKNVGFRADFFITAEGEKKYLIKVKQKGVLFLKLKVKGKGEHSAYTWKGVNAIKRFFTVYNKIETLFPNNREAKNHWYSTINLGKISGGIVANSVPTFTEGEIDIRFCEPWKTSSQVFTKIHKLISHYKNVFLEPIYKTEMTYTDKNNQNIISLNLIAKKILGFKKNLYFNNHGTNDARFASDLGIPAVGFGPTGQNYHADNEWVDIKSLEEYYQILKYFLLSLND